MPDALLVREAIRSENLPLDVFIVSDGERAIEFITKAENDGEATSPDLVLLDLNLPRIDGFDVLRRLRGSEKFKDIPVLVVTSSDSPLDRAETAKLGASYFRKPVTYDEFLAIGKFLRQFLQTHGLIT